MACSSKPGVKPFLDFIEATTGQKITQTDWHDIRQLAAEENGLERLPQSVAHEFNVIREFQLLNESIQPDTDDAYDDAWFSVQGNSVTEGTLLTLRYLSDHGVEETADKVAQMRAAKKVNTKDNEIAELKSALADMTQGIVDAARTERIRILEASETNYRVVDADGEPLGWVVEMQGERFGNPRHDDEGILGKISGNAERGKIDDNEMAGWADRYLIDSGHNTEDDEGDVGRAAAVFYADQDGYRFYDMDGERLDASELVDTINETFDENETRFVVVTPEAAKMTADVDGEPDWDHVDSSVKEEMSNYKDWHNGDIYYYESYDKDCNKEDITAGPYYGHDGAKFYLEDQYDEGSKFAY